jgi:hypothetical protein
MAFCPELSTNATLLVASDETLQFTGKARGGNNAIDNVGIYGLHSASASTRRW